MHQASNRPLVATVPVVFVARRGPTVWVAASQIAMPAFGVLTASPPGTPRRGKLLVRSIDALGGDRAGRNVDALYLERARRIGGIDEHPDLAGLGGGDVFAGGGEVP